LKRFHFFAELPEPLVNLDLATGCQTYSKELYQKLVQQIPNNSKKLLRYVLRFLQKVSSPEIGNGVTAADIGLMFGPAIIRAEKETFQHCQLSLIELVVCVMKNLIDKQEEIFSVKIARDNSAGAITITPFLEKEKKEAPNKPLPAAPKIGVKPKSDSQITPREKEPTDADKLSASVPVVSPRKVDRSRIIERPTPPPKPKQDSSLNISQDRTNSPSKIKLPEPPVKHYDLMKSSDHVKPIEHVKSSELPELMKSSEHIKPIEHVKSTEPETNNTQTNTTTPEPVHTPPVPTVEKSKPQPPPKPNKAKK